MGIGIAHDASCLIFSNQIGIADHGFCYSLSKFGFIGSLHLKAHSRLLYIVCIYIREGRGVLFVGLANVYHGFFCDFDGTKVLLFALMRTLLAKKVVILHPINLKSS